MRLRLFTPPLAVTLFVVSFALSAAPATAQSAQFICSADEFGRPTNCVSTSGGVADPPAQPSYQQSSPQRPSYKRPSSKPASYKRPRYQQPTYQQSSYQQPAYQQPYYQQPVYQQPAYQQPYPAPAYYPAASYQPPQYPSSCCYPVSKRGLFTSLSLSFCNNSAVPQHPQYPASMPYPQYPQYSYPPQYQPYPQYPFIRSRG